jgi:hypothetical protein
MIIYIAGPMTGLPGFNYETFHAVSKGLRNLGFAVRSPAELYIEPYPSYEEAMKGCLLTLLHCDTITLLPGWERSKGATLEAHVAYALRYPFVHYLTGERLMPPMALQVARYG